MSSGWNSNGLDVVEEEDIDRCDCACAAARAVLAYKNVKLLSQRRRAKQGREQENKMRDTE